MVVNHRSSKRTRTTHEVAIDSNQFVATIEHEVYDEHLNYVSPTDVDARRHDWPSWRFHVGEANRAIAFAAF
jgi:hypothetical protein